MKTVWLQLDESPWHVIDITKADEKCNRTKERFRFETTPVLCGLLPIGGAWKATVFGVEVDRPADGDFCVECEARRA